MPHPRNRTPAGPEGTQVNPAGFRVSRWLTSGVPHIAPFTAIAAAMTVLALAISGPEITGLADPVLAAGDWTQPHTWAALLAKIGISGLGFLPVAVAGYVAYGMAGKPAAIPGVLGGMAAMSIGGGALLGLGAGLLAGTAAMALRRIPLPPRLRGIGSTVLVPALAALVTVSVLIVLVQPLIGDLTEWLHLKLAWWQFHNTVLMGLVLGLMACSDFGGAISKAALAYAAVGVSGPDPSKFNTANMTIAAVVVAAGMAPALGMTLATLVRRSLFTDVERAYGKAAWLFGAAGLPEGAAPFALADPLRVLPASMAGGAVTGALVTALGTTDSLPVGGFFSIADVGKPLLFVLAVTAGVVVTAGVAVALKSLRKAEVPVSARATRLRTRVAASG